MAEQGRLRKAEVLSEYTFKPQVSTQSLLIARGLRTDFHTRQQIFLERRQRAVSVCVCVFVCASVFV